MSDTDKARFAQAYETGDAPWDIGRPQRAIVRAAETGLIEGHVLDIGCGTGEHALFLAQMGYYVWGIDFAETAINTAREKAHERGLDARFFHMDALEIDTLDTPFDTVIDSGLFHVFSDDEREAYVAQLARVTRAGGRVILLCFSNLEPGDWGPRRVSEDEIRASFTTGWRIQSIEPARFETTNDHGTVHAWLAVIERTTPI